MRNFPSGACSVPGPHPADSTLPTRKYEGRRNTDIAILLSTQATLHILCLLIT